MLVYNKMAGKQEWCLLVVLLFALLCSVLAISTYDKQELIDQLYDNAIGQEFGEPLMDENEDVVSMLKRGWPYKRRGGMKECGDNKLKCSGRCCGRINPICCKKGWTCRYMPRRRSFVCIP